MSFDDFEYYIDKLPKDPFKKRLYLEGLKEKFTKELKENEKAKEYFKPYEENSVETFILQYIKQKVSLIEYQSIYTEEKYHVKELKYREDTENIFNIILQKKLWDIQLKWRAGQIDIKEIRISFDFNFWEDHVSSCPFIPMVTETEIEIMKQFLKENNEIEKWFSWQDYHDIMGYNDEEDSGDIPEFYDFYNMRMGTNSLMLLPNKRGKLEDYYFDKGREYNSEQIKKNPPPSQPTYVSPNHIFAGFEDIYNFAKVFETDKYFKELFVLHQKTTNYNENKFELSETLHDAIEILSEADRPVPIQGGSDWIEAVIKCSKQYLNNILINELDVIYNEYKMFNEIGVSTRDENLLKEFEEYDFTKSIIKFIYKGRELCGESQDLSFLYN